MARSARTYTRFPTDPVINPTIAPRPTDFALDLKFTFAVRDRVGNLRVLLSHGDGDITRRPLPLDSNFTFDAAGTFILRKRGRRGQQKYH